MKILVGLILMLAAASVGYAQTQPKTTSVKIYFSKDTQSDDCSAVSPVTRIVPKTAAAARAALIELLKGTSETERKNGYSSFFSDKTATALIDVKVKNKTAYVNLKNISAELNGANSSCGRDTFFAQVETTLKQFSSIKKVFFAFHGKPQDFYDFMELECPDELKNCASPNFR